MLQPNVRESPAGIVDEISTKAPHVPLAHVALSTFPHLPALTPQKCIRALNLSVFNPPPAHRKVAGVALGSFVKASTDLVFISSRKLFLGDLLYLDVVTLEGTSACVTASVGGFYVNQSNNTTFNPAPAERNCASLTLIELLGQVCSLMVVLLVIWMFSREPFFFLSPRVLVQSASFSVLFLPL